MKETQNKMILKMSKIDKMFRLMNLQAVFSFQLSIKTDIWPLALMCHHWPNSPFWYSYSAFSFFFFLVEQNRLIRNSVFHSVIYFFIFIFTRKWFITDCDANVLVSCLESLLQTLVLKFSNNRCKMVVWDSTTPNQMDELHCLMFSQHSKNVPFIPLWYRR